MTKQFRTKLLNSIKDSTDDFSQFAELIQNKKSENIEALSEALDTYSQQEISKLFEHIWTPHLERTIQTIVEHATEDAEKENNKENNKENQENLLNMTQESVSKKSSKRDFSWFPFLDSVTTVCNLFIKDSKHKATDSLTQVASSLHDILLILQSFEDDSSMSGKFRRLCNDIAEMCETWWNQERPQREQFVPQTISFLLLRALEVNGKVADVQRVHAFRSGLLLIDFQDPSSVSLKRLLLRCLMHPAFLKNAKGRAFLVYLFGLYPPFVDEIHTTIKAQLLSARKSILEVYGEVYYKAWKVASGPYLLKIEYACLQDLMSLCVHAANPQLHGNIRKVLAHIHSKKQEKNVDKTLLRLYEPILWRSLNVANPMVRRNAASLLIDAFPLQDPDAPQRETDEILQKQVTVLESLLFDSCVNVRTAAVSGVCKILGIFWELIPDQTLRVLIGHLVNKLACDASSSHVRVAVLQGIQYILDNHLSQPILKVVLPRLSKLVHDKSEQVRSAMIDLLIFIKSIKFIRFYEIVPVEELLDRMVIDNAAICKKITQLLLNSYCAVNKAPPVQIKRTRVLIEGNPLASLNFYSNVHHHVPPSASTKYIGVLYKYLIRCVEKKTSKNKDADKDEEDCSLACLIYICDIISKIFENVQPQLKAKENQQFQKYLSETFTDDSLIKLFEFFARRPLLQPDDDTPIPATTTQALDSVCRIASFLPRSNLPAFSKNAFGQLKEYQAGKSDENSAQYSALLNCLFAWDKGDQVLDLIHDWMLYPILAHGIIEDRSILRLPKSKDADISPASKNGKKKGKKSKSDKSVEPEETVEDPSLKAAYAMQFLNTLMANPTTRKLVIKEPEATLPMLQALLHYFVLIEQRVTPTEESEQDELTDDLLLLAFLTYSKLFIHLNGSFEIEKDTEALTELVRWTEEVLLPAFFPVPPAEPEAEKSKSKKRKGHAVADSRAAVKVDEAREQFIENLVFNASIVLTECVTFHFCTNKMMDKIATVIQTMLDKTDAEFLTNILPVVSKLICQLQYQGNMELSIKLLSKALESAASVKLLEISEPSKDKEAKKIEPHKLVKLGDLMNWHHQHDTLPVFMKELLQIIWEDIEIPSHRVHLSRTFAEFPQVAAFVLSTIQRSTNCVNGLSHLLTQKITKSQFSVEDLWRTLEICSVLILEEPSKAKKPDMSSIQNCLINIVSKIPGSDLNDSASDRITEGYIRELANNLLKNTLNNKRASISG